jgi:rSAM/selenodomain-associated transferase 2
MISVITESEELIPERMNSWKISIIIPVLNESEYLAKTCVALQKSECSCEIIIVDGGSIDGTPELGSKYGIIISSPRGRSAQMNAGASKATGDILWFLHADCIPHVDSLSAIKQIMQNKEVIGGAFEYRMDGDGIIYRIAESLSNLKNKRFLLLYGDMGIFTRASTFRQLRGFREIPIMEDLDFGQRLKKLGKIVILPLPIMTSARRWKKEGPVKNFSRNWLLQLGWAFGISADYLAKWYPFDVK